MNKLSKCNITVKIRFQKILRVKILDVILKYFRQKKKCIS